MDLGLEGLEGYLLAIDADVRILLVLGNNAKCRYLVILDERIIKKGVVAYGQQESRHLGHGDISIHHDKIHEAVTEAGGVEEDDIGGHVGDLV